LEKLKVILLRIVLTLLAHLPLSVVQAIGALLAWCSWLLKGRSARITRCNLALCFAHLSQQERDRLARQSLIETGKTLAEMGKAWLAPPATTLSYITKVTDQFGLQQAFEKGRGVIAIVPHLGNWEVLNLYAADCLPLNILYQPPKIKALDPFILAARSRTGTKVYPTDRSGVAAMFQALRNGELVGILPDQVPPPAAALFAPFFGIPAATMTLISRLAQKTGAPVMCAYAKRLPRGRGFEVVFKPADPEIMADDLQRSVAALNRSIEACVMEALSQYQWEYKRFKTGPNGKTQFYNR